MSVENPKIMIRWQDNNSGKWSNEHYLSLGNQGETELILRMLRGGIFRTRQWEIVVTDKVAVALGDAEVDLTPIR